MRLDKYLKVARIIKRRTLAKEVCDQGRVKINGRTAKAGTAVAVGDQIEIDFGSRIVVFRVEKVADSVSKADAPTLYTVIDEKSVI